MSTMPPASRASGFICAIVVTSVAVGGAAKIAATLQELDDQCALQLKTTAPLRVGIFMTTHWSTLHQQFMPCWETARQQLTLVRNADLILYTSGNIGSKDLEKLGFGNLTIKHYKQAKYEEGAIQATIDAFGSKGQQEKWFDRYDWVVRLNPDVLIMDDNWLLETMGNSSVDAIFVDCVGQINTDFFAVRPHVIQANLADSCTSGPGDTNAETHFTCVVSTIISSGRYVWVKGAQNIGGCRVAGAESPVVHEHGFRKCCPDYLSAQANCSRVPVKHSQKDLLQLSSEA
ncbi:unnamed protein product [Symbiodinium necroappetens]|uniref:Uncharacterized protein n=1 Tax=Symbiodinium necroappetens TaxID=1628268 RepID=A0A812PDG7_9DINO|nr:unnamed protein product [Symbiodinium necroappetens]|mmetsp:Transcript_4135/g.9972  ORF Transcript_4135/g.9972 Transcript_4135/m.9972 type:complete len:288 (+) Transcript_4135:50-913(+)